MKMNNIFALRHYFLQKSLLLTQRRLLIIEKIGLISSVVKCGMSHQFSMQNHWLKCFSVWSCLPEE